MTDFVSFKFAYRRKSRFALVIPFALCTTALLTSFSPQVLAQAQELSDLDAPGTTQPIDGQEDPDNRTNAPFPRITVPQTAPPLRTITEPQPESRAQGIQSRTDGSRAADRLFSGPIDPDTQDVPTLGLRGSGEGSRIGLPRQNGEIQPGQRETRRVGRNGRILRPGDPGYEDAASVAVRDGDLSGDGQFFAPQAESLDGDIDPDLRFAADDDLVIAEPRPADEALTGPTSGAVQLLRRDRLLQEAGANPFTAQRRQDFPEVDDRPYDPLGIRAGSFVFLPTLTATTVVTDNVFNAAGPAESDIGLELRPTLSVQSDWNRHSFALDANASGIFYSEFDSENETSAALVARARIDVTLRTNIEIDAGYQLTQEQAGSANSVSGAVSEPDVTTLQAGVAFNHRFNRLVSRTRLGYTEEINGDAELIGGGVDLGIDEDFSRVDIAQRLTYEFSPSFAAFVEGAYNQQTFDIGADADGILRDSHGYELRVGVTTEVGPTVRAELSVGYATQISDDARLADVDGVVLDADVVWRPNALTTVNLLASTDIETSTIAGSLGALNYQTALNIRHEFRRHLIGTLGFGWARQDFQGSDVIEDELAFQIGGEYLFTRNLAALASYDHTSFTSTLPASDYTANTFRLGLQVRR